MQIQVNGEIHQVADELSLAQLIQQLGLEGQRLAVEINREIVPRSQHASHPIQADDQIEIVRAIGGGQACPRSTEHHRP